MLKDLKGLAVRGVLIQYVNVFLHFPSKDIKKFTAICRSLHVSSDRAGQPGNRQAEPDIAEGGSG